MEKLTQGLTKKTIPAIASDGSYFFKLAGRSLKQVKQMLRKIFLNEIVIIYVIVANSALLFAMGFPELHEVRIFDRIDHFFTLFFLIEMSVKIYYYGWKEYIASAWNKFDFVLVMISVPSFHP